MNKILINDLNPETGKYKEKPKGAKVEVLFPYVQNRTLITPRALHACALPNAAASRGRRSSSSYLCRCRCRKTVGTLRRRCRVRARLRTLYSND